MRVLETFAHLLAEWSHVASWVNLRHVKSHSGQHHNELADMRAKLAMLSRRPGVATFMQDSPHVVISTDIALCDDSDHACARCSF